MQTFYRFVVVGMANTAVGFTAIAIALLIGLGDYSANAVGYLIGLTCSYLLNSRWTFAGHHRPAIATMARYGVTAFCAYSCNLGALYLARRYGLAGTLMAQIPAMAVYTAVFYTLSRYFVFRGGHDK